jgi:hypothetical protein
MKLSLLLTLVSQALSQIIFTFSSPPFGNQCVNNLLSIFGLNMSVKGSINGISFNLPMGELGLPIINMDWFVNGIPANQLAVAQNFNVGGSTTSGNRWSFQLQDDQPNIGAGIITLGPCVQGTTSTVTASFSTTTFIVGVGFPSLNLPAAIGIPTIINNLAPQNIQGGGITQPTTTFLRTTLPTSLPTSLPTTTLPTTTLPTSSTLSKIIFTFTSVPLNKQCVNNKLSVFGLNMFVKGSVNGIPFNAPLSQIGLPVINMNWFFNGNAVNPIVVLQTFNVDGSMTSGNTWTFQLKNFQGNIGASVITLGSCVQGSTLPLITVTFSTTSFLTGTGVPNQGIPSASGIPTIVNNLTI